MKDEEYEFVLTDRMAKIQAINEQYDLEHNSYISFSGGKDSTVLHYLIDIALPNNKIPRLFLNTGLEYSLLRKHVEEMSISDNRIVLYNSGVNIKNMLEENGYPFKSKQHSHNWSLYANNYENCNKYIKEIYNDFDKLKDVNYIHNLPNGVKTTIKYIFGVREKEIPNNVVERERERVLEVFTSDLIVPNKLRYQFTEDFVKSGFKLSDKCCYKLKKEVALKWEEDNNRSIAMTGIRAEEGGMRNQNGCTIFNDGKLKKFHPIKVISDEWEDEFIKRNNIKLCDLYYPPYNFVRTGCKGCPFALDLQEQLLIMKKLLPNEYKQCLILWKPVYDEYVRLGYRLDKDFYDLMPQYTIEDFL